MTIRHYYFVRHGESLANVGGATQPDALIALTDKGWQQAEGLIQRLNAPMTAAYTSELLRTQQTAQAWCQHQQLQPTALSCLNEICVLDYERIRTVSVATRRQWAQDYWQQADVHATDGPSADSFIGFAQRVDDFLALLPEFPNHSVFFTHGIWIGMLAWKLLGFACDSSHNMHQFRSFQTAMAMANTVIYGLQWDDASDLRQLRLHSVPDGN